MSFTNIASLSPTPKNDLLYAGTGPIPASPYYDEGYFEREREAVFRASWLHIGHVSELPNPGDFIVRDVELLGVSILVTRYKDGKIGAFHNVCTHRGTALVWEGKGNARVFSCPYHGWSFTNEGELAGVPDLNSFFDLDKSSCNLKPIHIGVCSGLIFVNVTPGRVQSLAEFLGVFHDEIGSKHIEEFTGFGELRYRVKSNWKLAYDNFQEGYHIRSPHWNTAVRLTTSSQNPFGHPVEFRMEGIHRICIFRPNASYVRTPVEEAIFQHSKGFSESEIRGVFPNFYVNTDSGMAWTRQVWPLSVDESELVLRFYKKCSDKDDIENRFAEEYAIGRQFDVEAQDIGVINQNQRGIQSRALDHIHFQANEIMLRHSFETIDSKVREYSA